MPKNVAEFRIVFAYGLLALSLEAVGCQSQNETDAVTSRVIYGTNDRRSEWHEKNAAERRIGDGIAILLDDARNPDRLRPVGNEYEVKLGVSIEGRVPLGSPLCAGEKFGNQRSGGECTAFVVGPNLMATAGHCFTGDLQAACDKTAVVFGYRKASQADTTGEGDVFRVDADRVYWCEEVIHHAYDGAPGVVATTDYAIFRVTKPITNATTLEIGIGPVPVGANVYVAGHPLGIPLKYSGGVVKSTGNGLFHTNASVHSGLSGAPVLMSGSNLVVGIHIASPDFGSDFYPIEMPSGDYCYEWRRCSAIDGCNRPPVFSREQAFGAVPFVQLRNPTCQN